MVVLRAGHEDIFLAGLAYAGLRPRLRALTWWVSILRSAPPAIDGATYATGDR